MSVFSIDFTAGRLALARRGLGEGRRRHRRLLRETHNFPHLAAKRLQRTLSGHYELEVRKPPTTFRGTHAIEVEVARRDAYVMARSTYIDR